jgi:hypothetical protein
MIADTGSSTSIPAPAIYCARSTSSSATIHAASAAHARARVDGWGATSANRAMSFSCRSRGIVTAHRNRHDNLLFALSTFSRILRSGELAYIGRRWIGSRPRGAMCGGCSPRRSGGDQGMGRLSLSGPARFQRRVIGVLGVIPNAPTHRRDTIECALDCGHARSVLRINRGEAPFAGQCRDLIGAELQCAKCAVLERIRREARVRGNRRRLSGWATLGSGSGAAG